MGGSRRSGLVPTVVVLVLGLVLLAGCRSSEDESRAVAPSQDEPGTGVGSTAAGQPQPECVPIGEPQPTMDPGDPDAEVVRLPYCDEAVFPPELPDVLFARYPSTGEQYPCVHFDAEVDIDSYDMVEVLSGQLRWSGRIERWVNVVDPPMSRAPRNAAQPFLFDIAGDVDPGVDPVVYGDEILAVAIELADGRPARVGLDNHSQAAIVGFDDGQQLVPLRWCFMNPDGSGSPSYLTHAISDFLARTGQANSLGSAREFFWSLAGDPDAPAVDRAELAAQIESFRVTPTPVPTFVPWLERPVSERNLADAPSDILSQLTSKFLTVELPADWMGGPGLLCTRSEMGWSGTCTPIDFGAGVEGGPASPFDGMLPLDALYRPGDLVEIVLFEGSGPSFGAAGSMPTHRVLGAFDADSLTPDADVLLPKVTISADVTVIEAVAGLGSVAVEPG